jgi:ubiquinone/menaquinone biosynthesis C-methylase UbiE
MKTQPTNDNSLTKGEQILQLNKEKYKIQDFQVYENHRFCSQNISSIRSVVQEIYNNTEGKKCLDIGVGSGLVLLRELELFDKCLGLDLSLNMALSKGIPKDLLVEGNCYQLPFKNEEFDLVSACALLHHLADIQKFYLEAFRVLKPGGYLYTDGDKNIFCVKLERRMKMIQYLLSGKKNSNEFKYYRDRLIYRDSDEYHSMGLNYNELERKLRSIGFRKVILTPMFSVNPNHTKKLSFRIMKTIHNSFKFKFCFTHIRLIAIK